MLLYNWQPQRIDFFPRPAPVPNPPVDPDSGRLFAKGTKIAVVTAHPDDTEFYIGGLLTKLHETGAVVSLIVCTDGDKGYYPFEDAERNRRVRRAEQLRAASEYGCTDVTFLAEPDGRLRSDDRVVREVFGALERIQPEYILAFDDLYPPRLQHSDHMRAGEAAAGAAPRVTSARWLLKFSTHAANFFVDISGEWPVKQELLKLHVSQFHGKRLAQIIGLVRGRAQSDGRHIGVAYAEGFRAVRLR